MSAREWDGYTGRTLVREVTYMTAGGEWGLPADLCVLAIADVGPGDLARAQESGRAHDLKTWPAPWVAVQNGTKPYEVRVNDRDYRVGDVLVLREWVPEEWAL